MKRVIGWLAVLAVLCGLAWSGLQLFTSMMTRRYAVLSTAGEAALNRNDTQAAARLALAAMQGRDLPFPSFDNRRATALLRDALMTGKTPLIETSRMPFPQFTITGDVVPPNAAIGSDGKRLMILHNEDRAHPIVGIYALPSGRLIRQFPERDTGPDGAEGAIFGFSPDLSTAIHWRTNGVYFGDVDSDQPVLTDFKAPPGDYDWSVSNDRRFVTAHGDKGLRTWDFSAHPVRVTDIPYGSDGYADDFDIAPGGKTAIVGTLSLTGAGSSRTVIELPSRRVKLTIRSDGPIDAAFSQDGQYLVTSVITGETPDHLTWTHGTRVWSLSTGQPIGPVLDFGNIESAQTLFNGRILVITTLNQAWFFDLDTARLVGTAVDLPSDLVGSSAFTDANVYAIDETHVLVRYNLNPLLGMPAKALAVEACHRWGTKGKLTLMPGEAAASNARFRIDPCH